MRILAKIPSVKVLLTRPGQLVHVIDYKSIFLSCENTFYKEEVLLGAFQYNIIIHRSHVWLAAGAGTRTRINWTALGAKC